MGEAGRRRVEKLFSIEKNIAQIEKLYEELLCRDM
jgi:glycosyltransferase involved in cell wall biosynthesis